MMDTLLITGAEGFLGVRVVQAFSFRYKVVGCSHAELDITDNRSVARLFREVKPQRVLHCAAISDTGVAENNPDRSYAVNVLGTVRVAKACADSGARLVYISSDQVYNGNVETFALPESVALHPENVYGRHKLEAEQRVGEVLPEAVALRLTWMYDLPTSPYKLNRNILVNLQRAAATATPLRAALRELRGMTSVWNIISHLDACFDIPGGVYNYGCPNDLCSYDTFLAVARLMYLPHPEAVVLCDSDRFPAHVRNLAMDISKLRAQGITFPSTLDGFREALRDYRPQL
jgi:dTDP-4-dehydrorhamnose reductase